MPPKTTKSSADHVTSPKLSAQKDSNPSNLGTISHVAKRAEEEIKILTESLKTLKDKLSPVSLPLSSLEVFLDSDDVDEAEEEIDISPLARNLGNSVFSLVVVNEYLNKIINSLQV